MQEAHNSSEAFVVIERSLLSDRLVFVEAAYANQNISETELAVYDAVWSS